MGVHVHGAREGLRAHSARSASALSPASLRRTVRLASPACASLVVTMSAADRTPAAVLRAASDTAKSWTNPQQPAAGPDIFLSPDSETWIGRGVSGARLPPNWVRNARRATSCALRSNGMPPRRPGGLAAPAFPLLYAHFVLVC